MYYDYHKVISYNALLNFLIGERGVGKTYGASKFAVNRFIKHDEQFAYIRRYKSELKKSVPQFFEALNSNNEFEGKSLTSFNNKFYVDKKICGYAMPLSTAQDLKGTSFANVTTIIFDEFIIEEGQRKYYLQNEVFVFLNLIETIARMRKIRVFLLGNPANIYTNPYFMYFNLSVPFNNDIKLFKDNLILVQYMHNEEYRNAKKQTDFGKLVSGTSFEDYAINNKPLSFKNDFLGKKSGSAKFSFAFIYNNETFGVWFDYSLGLIFVSYDYDKTSPFIYATTLSDHSTNTLLLNTAKKFSNWKDFIHNYSVGNVRFENNKIKYVCQELIRNIIIK